MERNGFESFLSVQHKVMLPDRSISAAELIYALGKVPEGATIDWSNIEYQMSKTGKVTSLVFHGYERT